MLENTATEISLQDLQSSLASSQPPVVAEILGPQYFAGGHLPGAVNLPLEGFAELATRLLPDKTAEIVVYCSGQTCQNSDIAQRKLRSMGYKKVRVFKGGKAEWSAAGQPLVAA
jgi:rhodanese-related sulfurtransferase